ncbi:hypothetical protein AVEN_53802-1 [Araneus ventricosus]|uniref:Uncharacterized protein n=1 Tax=Araneus ventricosus TaxID=182803 RepID=A0A4Y2VMI4_ARAVE|nr:hypothetical protein AVEN_53802-1 [Araneus ventricosus]
MKTHRQRRDANSRSTVVSPECMEVPDHVHEAFILLGKYYDNREGVNALNCHRAEWVGPTNIRYYSDDWGLLCGRLSRGKWKI